jgi:saccharopine dehydrogenase-like NADP-dependent oxidoreductase
VNKVLVLGAGLVSGPLIHYLLAQEGFEVTVATRTVEKAEKLLGKAKNGVAVAVNVDEERSVEGLIQKADLAISLLPYVYHPVVARLCVKHKRQMVTTSYVKDAMGALDAEAKRAGVVLLNEIGVDPGIDHMSAMEVIHRARKEGGEVESFTSWCGGLPAPEANTNPFGYKFSWSPRGVVMAGKNPAKYLKDGKVVDIPGPELFAHHEPVAIEGFGTLEGYPNRDSLPYRETYGIPGVNGMFRGTLRYPGWCETMKGLVDLGMLDETERKDLARLSFRDLTGRLAGGAGEDVRRRVASRLKVDPTSFLLDRYEWLGLFGTDPLPAEAKSCLDVLAARMLERMPYLPGERDLLVMQHEFVVRYPSRKERITATLVDYGIPGGDSSMSRLVGLPAAIAAKHILLGTIRLTGVHTPVLPEIYESVLAELSAMGVTFREKRERILA